MRRHLAAVLVLLLVSVILAGCGSSAGASSSTPKRSFSAFTACLKRHGVTGAGGGQPPAGGQFPGGGQPPSGSPPSGGQPPNISSKMQKAFAACSSLAPRAGQGGFGPPGGFPNGG